MKFQEIFYRKKGGNEAILSRKKKRKKERERERERESKAEECIRFASSKKKKGMADLFLN
jgi:hypothetical protein